MYKSWVIYSEFHNYLDTVGGVFNPDYTDTSDFAGGLRRFLSHKADLLQCLLEKRLLISRIHYSFLFWLMPRCFLSLPGRRGIPGHVPILSGFS